MISAKEARERTTYIKNNFNRIAKTHFLEELEKQADHRIRSMLTDSDNCGNNSVTLLFPVTMLPIEVRIKYAKEFFEHEKNGYKFTSYTGKKSRFYTISW